MAQETTSKKNGGNNNHNNNHNKKNGVQSQGQGLGIVKKFGNEDIVYTLQLKLEFDQKVGKPTINVYSNSIDDVISKIEEAYSKLKTRFENNGIPIAPICVTHSQLNPTTQKNQQQQQVKEEVEP
jgi:hypothetical protein